MPSIEDAVRRNMFLAAVVGWWRQRLLSRGSGDFGDLDDRELTRMASDLGLERRDLVQLAAEGPQAARFLDRMLASYGLDRSDLQAKQAAILRDMVVRCSLCTEKGRCAHELDAGTAAANAGEFCPNATTMQALGD